MLDFLVGPGGAPPSYAPPQGNRASSDRGPCSYPPSLPRIAGTDWLVGDI